MNGRVCRGIHAHGLDLTSMVEEGTHHRERHSTVRTHLVLVQIYCTAGGVRVSDEKSVFLQPILVQG